MSATVTVSSAALQPLCLFSQGQKSADEKAKTPPPPKKCSPAVLSPDTEEWAVDRLAQQLWTRGRISQEPCISPVSSRLVFDAEALCDRDPYVRIDVDEEAAGGSGQGRRRVTRPAVSLGINRHAQAAAAAATDTPASLCSPLIRVQPKTNPFKRMAVQPPTTAPPTLSLSARPADEDGSRPTKSPPVSSHSFLCVHCKRGNFLEFCFAGDRCLCGCHEECPCKPCVDIRRLRHSPSAECSQGSQRTASSFLDSRDDFYYPLATAPLLRCSEET
ncbi:hypothetical protein GGF46_001388 [Coemansia sp. RSA 552]|nr:hypothetical protein GGF46_001388 [Coemansia sp. RSA 552]